MAISLITAKWDILKDVDRRGGGLGLKLLCTYMHHACME